ncbi:hypothetical protein [Aquimarina megaterium]|uniref:hypothetical protein n=1 Tax=Aquimarina megaterium TaxID=1443666 RepID=UPI00094216EC|nr:hypothetical protein [Aquimarina megaterium]
MSKVTSNILQRMYQLTHNKHLYTPEQLYKEWEDLQAEVDDILFGDSVVALSDKEKIQLQKLLKEISFANF